MSATGALVGQQAETAELSVPLLSVQHDANEIITEAGAGQDAAFREGDLEQGLVAGSDAEAPASSKAEEEAIERAARASHQSGPVIYIVDLLRLAVFYWAIVADVLLMKELYNKQYMVFAGVSTGFTVGPHVFMSLLLIVRQGWLQAASQACGFILTLNPFESLTPIPQGIFGLFVISIGFVAYVLIAASGLIFVAYCVVCYLVTALLFSLLILDLAALVITVAPSKAIFKYTDLVYTENFKSSRLVLQAWLQSVPELVMICFILYRNISPQGPAVVINGVILWQALAAHCINIWDKMCMFRSAAKFSGASYSQQLLLLLGVKASCRLSLPVLRENLSRVLRGTGGAEGGAGLGSVVHISSAEEAPDNDSEAAASMVPEYLTPTNGGLLSPGQLMALARAVLGQYGGPGVAELVLEITPDVMAGKLLSELISSVPNTSSVRLVNASVRAADASLLASALLQCGSLRTLQLHQVVIDERGAMALMHLLEHTPTLQQLDLCRCKLKRKAALALAQGFRCNKTLRQLNLAGTRGLDEAGTAALAAALACSKVLCALNMAFVKLGSAAVDSLAQAINSSSSLQVLAVSQDALPVDGARKLTSAIAALCSPKAPPSLSCNLTLGSFPVDGLEKVQWLAVQDQDALILDAWQGLAGPSCSGLGEAAGGFTSAGGDAAAVDAGTVAGAMQLGSTSSTSNQYASAVAPDGVVSERTPLLSSTAAAVAAGSSHGSAGYFLHAPHTAFDVASPAPAGQPSSSSMPSNAQAAWFSSSSRGVDSIPTSSNLSSSRVPDDAASSSKAASSAATTGTDLHCPTLVFVVTQDEVFDSIVRAPLLFQELDTLDLTGLGVGDEGAQAMAKVLEDQPAVRRIVLADNKVGEAGGAALAAALTLNTTLQVLDLSANELSETGVCVLADATRRAAGLRQLRLLGNKIPFGLSTLRKLVEAEAASPHCHLVLVEDPSEVLEELSESGDTSQAERAADFFKRQEEYRTARRQRMAARQQKLQRLEEQAAAAAAIGSKIRAGTATSNDDKAVSSSTTAVVVDIEAPGAASSSRSAAVSAAASAEGSSSRSCSPSRLRKVQVSSATAVSEAGSNGSPARSASGAVSVGGDVFLPASPLAGSVSSITADEDTCGVCFDNNNHVAIKYCGHRLCVDCYRKVWELSGIASSCPFCRAKLEGYIYLDWPLDP